MNMRVYTVTNWYVVATHPDADHNSYSKLTATDSIEKLAVLFESGISNTLMIMKSIRSS